MGLGEDVGREGGTVTGMCRLRNREVLSSGNERLTRDGGGGKMNVFGDEGHTMCL